MNVMPTRRTRLLARQMLGQVKAGRVVTDVVVEYLPDFPADQHAALVSLLLEVAVPKKYKPLTLSPDERARAHAQYTNGARTEFAVRGHREYMRAHQRGYRSPARQKMEARLAREEALYTDDEARRARNATLKGDSSEWARVGARVYYRRAKSGQYRHTHPEKDVA